MGSTCFHLCNTSKLHVKSIYLQYPFAIKLPNNWPPVRISMPCFALPCRLEAYASDTSGTGPISNDKLGKNNFLEIGCLYAINQSKSHVTVTWPCMWVSHDFAAAEHVQKYIDGHDISKEFDESVDLHTKVSLLQLSRRYQFSPAHLRHPGLKHCFFDLGEELEGGGRAVNIFSFAQALYLLWSSSFTGGIFVALIWPMKSIKRI